VWKRKKFVWISIIQSNAASIDQGGLGVGGVGLVLGRVLG
jgi:hypothetical protein